MSRRNPPRVHGSLCRSLEFCRACRYNTIVVDCICNLTASFQLVTRCVARARTMRLAVANLTVVVCVGGDLLGQMRSILSRDSYTIGSWYCCFVFSFRVISNYVICLQADYCSMQCHYTHDYFNEKCASLPGKFYYSYLHFPLTSLALHTFYDRR